MHVDVHVPVDAMSTAALALTDLLTRPVARLELGVVCDVVGSLEVMDGDVAVASSVQFLEGFVYQRATRRRHRRLQRQHSNVGGGQEMAI